MDIITRLDIITNTRKIWENDMYSKCPVQTETDGIYISIIGDLATSSIWDSTARRTCRKIELRNSSQDVCGILGLWSRVAKPIAFFLTTSQNLLCCGGVAAPTVLQNQLCGKTTCAANFRSATLSIDRQLVELQNLLAGRTRLQCTRPWEWSRVAKPIVVFFDNVAKPIVFFFWQCCKTCFIVAVLQHRLCCKTSCVAKPHVLRISCPQHYMLFGSLLSSWSDPQKQNVKSTF